MTSRADASPVATAEPPGSVVVTRLTWQRELALVIRAAFAIAAGTWLYLAGSLSDAGGSQKALLPFQVLAASLPSADQRMFRELQEGLLEAEGVRGTTGQWPSPGTLADVGIPPFATDPTARDRRYMWALHRSGNLFTYVAASSVPSQPSWLLHIQEPEPGAPPDQAWEDEEHHKLLDGRMLHVSTWTKVEGTVPVDRTVPSPQTEGWRQVYAVGPGKGQVAIIPQ